MSTTESAATLPIAQSGAAVRIWHLLFLYTVILAAAVITATKFTASVDSDVRAAFRLVVMQALMAAGFLVITVVVPELRKSVPTLYGPRRQDLSFGDVALFIALMFTWGLGASRLLITLPVLTWRPDLFAWFGLTEHYPEMSATFTFLWLSASCVIAPFAEELFFRGYLQNALGARWGLWAGIIVSSLLFGIVHEQGAAFATLAGAFLSLIYVRSGSLWPGTLLHGLYNLGINIPGLKSYFVVKARSEATMIGSWIPEIALAVLFIPLLYLFWRRFRPVN